MTTTPRFGRVCTVDVTETGNIPVLKIEGYDGMSSPPNGLRISFRAERKIAAVASSCTIQIYNLSPASRGTLAQRSLAIVRADPLRYVRLDAGYLGGAGKAVKGVLFYGVIVRCTNQREGPDWITTIEANAAFGFALLNTIQKSWDVTAGLPVRTVLTELITNIGFTTVTFSPQAELILAVKFTHTVVVTGSGYEAVRRICEEYGLVFWVDIGGAAITAKGYPKSTVTLSIDEDTGLLGTPKVTDLGAEFRTLLDPRLEPGNLVIVTSHTLLESIPDPSIGMLYTLWDLTIVGDTHGNDWFCDCSAWFFPPVTKTALPVAVPSLISP